jgi:hypothetical protein
MARDRKCLTECKISHFCQDMAAKGRRACHGFLSGYFYTSYLLQLSASYCRIVTFGNPAVPVTYHENMFRTPAYLHSRRRSNTIVFFWVLLTAVRLEWSISLSANPLDWTGGMNGLIVPDNMKTINKAVEMARSPDSILIKPGEHKIGDHKIKAGLFHNNEACYWEPEIEINKQLELHGLQGASLSGMIILQQPVDVETWRPVSGGGLVDGLILSHKDLEGLHGYCVAVEGGRWVIEDCQIRCCGKYSKAIWVYGGEVSPLILNSMVRYRLFTESYHLSNLLLRSSSAGKPQPVCLY